MLAYQSRHSQPATTLTTVTARRLQPSDSIYGARSLMVCTLDAYRCSLWISQPTDLRLGCTDESQHTKREMKVRRTTTKLPKTKTNKRKRRLKLLTRKLPVLRRSPDMGIIPIPLAMGTTVPPPVRIPWPSVALLFVRCCDVVVCVGN